MLWRWFWSWHRCCTPHIQSTIVAPHGGERPPRTAIRWPMYATQRPSGLVLCQPTIASWRSWPKPCARSTHTDMDARTRLRRTLTGCWRTNQIFPLRPIMTNRPRLPRASPNQSNRHTSQRHHDWRVWLRFPLPCRMTAFKMMPSWHIGITTYATSKDLPGNVNPEYFVRTQFPYPWLSDLLHASNFRTVTDCCGFSDLLCTFRMHFIFVRRPPCMKYTKITCNDAYEIFWIYSTVSKLDCSFLNHNSCHRNHICTLMQDKTNNRVLRLPAIVLVGRKIVFNKTIAGRRRTLLLNVKPARMSVKR